MGPMLEELALRGDVVPDAVSLKSVTDGSETSMCGAPGGRSDAGRRLPRRAGCCPPPPKPCCLANVWSAACSACQSNVTLTSQLTSCLITIVTFHSLPQLLTSVILNGSVADAGTLDLAQYLTVGSYIRRYEVRFVQVDFSSSDSP